MTNILDRRIKHDVFKSEKKTTNVNHRNNTVPSETDSALI